MQNLPKKQESEFNRIFKNVDGVLNPQYRQIRESLCARPGHVLIEADWEQAELFTMGALAGDQVFLDALNNSDIHSETTIAALHDYEYEGRKLSDFSVEEFNKARKVIKELDALRVGVGKGLNFGAKLKI